MIVSKVFLSDRIDDRYLAKIPTGLILAGPNIAAHGKLFEQLAARIMTEAASPVVILHSGQASNLKTVLKQLIKGATSQDHGDEEEEVLIKTTKVRRLLLQ